MWWMELEVQLKNLIRKLETKRYLFLGSGMIRMSQNFFEAVSACHHCQTKDESGGENVIRVCLIPT
jgi:hypothetical protein